jgi:uncharacterized MAPEG superfamily protein
MAAAVELKLLAAAAAVGLVQLGWATALKRLHQDQKWVLGAQDDPQPPITGVPARLERAFANFQETFPVFAAALIAAVIMDKLGPLTLWGAWAYLVARILYAPLYAAGVPVVRTLVWLVSLVGIVMVLAANFL